MYTHVKSLLDPSLNPKLDPSLNPKLNTKLNPIYVHTDIVAFVHTLVYITHKAIKGNVDGNVDW